MSHAVQMLREDHRKVQELFKQFEKADGGEAKKHIAEQALTELEVHAALEEEVFYPAVREEIEEESKINEAEEEHHVVKLLVSELEKMDPEDERYSAKFKVLAESVKHHIQEEESNVIPRVEGVLDGATLGERMAQRKEQLQQQAGSSRKGSRRSAGRRTGGRRTTRKRAKSRSRR